MRMALENDYKRADERSIAMLDTGSGDSQASGEALRVRIAARTASLTQVAKVGAEGLQAALRQIASWLGLDPKKVSVKPNLEFAENTMMAQELLQLIEAKNQGAPLSIRTIHDILRQRKFTTKTYEEEVAEIGDETPNTGTGNPNTIDQSGAAAGVA